MKDYIIQILATLTSTVILYLFKVFKEFFIAANVKAKRRMIVWLLFLLIQSLLFTMFIMSSLNEPTYIIVFYVLCLPTHLMSFYICFKLIFIELKNKKEH